MKPAALLILICVSLAGLFGCRGGAVVPEGWTTYRLKASSEAILPNAAALWPVEDESLRDDEPRVQVFVHYNQRISTHTALRVTAPQAPPVFWDPGGNYGTTKPEYGRQNDVIVERPPNTGTWWAYRYHWLKEPFLYVFEWDVPAEQARTMREALLDGATHGRSATEFQTLRTPGFCNYAVADFLRAYASPPISAHLRGTFLPDGLARQLWQLHPDRVLRYEGEANALPLVLLPPGEDASSATSQRRSVDAAELFTSVDTP